MTAPTDYEIARAQRVGRAFARAGRALTDCPFDANGDGVQRVLTMRFTRAYLAERAADPDAVDFEDDDEFDEPAIDPDVQREVIARLGVDLDDEDEGDEELTRVLAAADRNQLKHYWTRGKGLARWISSPHPWTTLVRLLSKHVSRARAKRMASQWFFETHGYWPGHRKGENTVGPG